MKLEIEKEQLLPIWHDVIESLEIMRAFQNGEIKKEELKIRAKDGSRRLARARRLLDKLIGNPFELNDEKKAK